ncbi:DUF808 domain-containing protein [uncultured Pseudokineococcus sp.]|uniref:DUF808 domain-containing protein n=1 Tax=uncultured Pseudokineococcus sp. TaxID=1642928 RepID=UPI0026269891|nr:DUF808 domain-containing protein [uncultured Pseudokineococcus sp.]
MSAGLVALLDDVALLARAAAASLDDVGAAAARAGAKTAGVVVDDTAVTPQYVRGLAAEREVPIIRRIAVGSLRNKLLIILPVVLLLSWLLPVALTPLLMLGGAYLCFEGAEKVWGRLRGHGPHAAAGGPGGAAGGAALPDEDALVKGAVRTDLVLSAEIMVIALDEVVTEPFLTRAVVLALVGVAVTVGVYGVVALIVKMDDAGLRLAEAPSAAVARLGRGMVAALPKLLTVLTVVGTAAMLWVGGHLLLVGADELGLTAPYEVVHHAEEAVAEALGAVGPVAGWLVATLAAAVLGLLVGLLVVAVVHAVEVVRHHRSATDAAPSAH